MLRALNRPGRARTGEPQRVAVALVDLHLHDRRLPDPEPAVVLPSAPRAVRSEVLLGAHRRRIAKIREVSSPRARLRPGVALHVEVGGEVRLPVLARDPPVLHEGRPAPLRQNSQG